MNTFPRSDAKKKRLALALFDNLADSTDELSFRRGDTLTVLEQNTSGLDGWWLCSFRGREGIVPGNRLRLLPGGYDAAQAAKMAAQMTTGRYRRSWSPNAKTSPMNASTASLPRGTGSRSDRTMMRQYSGDTYDSPPPPAPLSVGGSPAQEDYDTPRPHRVPPPPPPASAKPTFGQRSAAQLLAPVAGAATYTAPSAATYSAPPPPSNRCSAVSITSAGSSTRSSSGSSSNRSSLEQAPEPSTLCRPPKIPENGLYDASEESEDYDVPRRVGPSWSPAEQDTYDVPPPARGSPRDGRGQPEYQCESETYDFPPPPPDMLSRGESENQRVCSPHRLTELPGDTYDFPPPPRSPPMARVESRNQQVCSPHRLTELPGDTYDFPPPPRSPPQPRAESRNQQVCSPHRLSELPGDTYDFPPPPRSPEPRSRLRYDSGDTYDIPPPPTGRLAELELSDSSQARGDTETDSPNDTLDTIETYDTYDYPRPSEDVYDSPRPTGFSPHRPEMDLYNSPRALSETSPRRGVSAAAVRGSRDSLQSSALSHRASTVSETSISSDQSDVVLRRGGTRGGTASRNATYWLRSAGSGGSAALSSCGEPRELPLDTAAGLETVSRLEQEVNATVDRLFTFVVPGWRSAAHMEACAFDLKLTIKRMRDALRDLIQFSYGAMVATTRGPEQRVGSQFVQVLRPLEESNRLITGAADDQDRAGWTPAALCKPKNAPQDALDQLLACARSLRGDVRQVVVFIRGNAAHIFRRRASVVPDRTSSPPHGPHGPRAGLMSDYDYVCLQTSGSLAEEGEEVRSRLPEELRGSFDNLMKESQVPVGNRVDANDQQVIEFYRGQTECHHEFLNNAIDALFQTIQNNQPPKVFVAHSKFVILSAHKLVYIGDTVHRNVQHPGVRRDALAAADALFATLKRTVQSTKTAALQFPSAHAVQEMADAVLDVSRAAEDLKQVMDEAAL